MSETDRMNVNERRKYLHKMRIRYWQTKGRAEKSRLLDDATAMTGLHRKTILRLLHGELARKPRQRQRGKTYGTEVIDAVRKIARSLDYPCAERMQPNLLWMADELVRHGELVLAAGVREKLGKVSISTVRRMVPPELSKPERIAYRPRTQATPRHIPAHIPMRRIPNLEPQPGHFEVDLVHHCGDSTSGQYVHTLQMTDVATGWCEPVAILGRSYLVMQDGFEHVQQRLPFPILELHPDNGAEFLNDFMLHFWKQHTPQASLSRSRPYHKNDNRFVEENNSSLVRAYLGYQRLDSVAQTTLLNQLYDKLWLYHNFFQPVMRLTGKITDATTHRIKRIYGSPFPPFDRLCKAGRLSPQQENHFRSLRYTTNPCTLRKEIHILLDQLFALPNAHHGLPEDVRQSIGLWKSGQKCTAHFSTGSTTTISPKGVDPSVSLSFDRTITVE
jgi:hypothetical protein